MAITDGEAADCARVLGRQIYIEAAKTAGMNLDDLKQAVKDIDTAMDATDTGGSKIKVYVNQQFSEPFASTATQTEKGFALKVWADWTVGLI